MIQTVHLSVANNTVPKIVRAVQNDTDRSLQMILDDMTLTSGLTGLLTFRRADGTYYQAAATLDTATNSFTAELDQALTCAGKTLCQLKVTATDTVSTFTFVVWVEADTSGTLSPQEGISLSEAVQRAEDAAERAEEAEDALEGLTLGINPNDDLLYIYVDGVPIGDGVDIGGVGTRYSIIWDLRNCSASPQIPSILENRTLIVTITPNQGYAVGTVTVTMGGQAVSGAYSNGVITVPNVNGNISITVTAIEAVTLSDGTVLSHVMFADDFDGENISSVWKLHTYALLPASRETYFLADNVTQEDSCLILALKADDSVSGYSLTGAQVSSQDFGTPDNYNFDTGYFEAKLKLDGNVSGFWPAIWHIGQTQSETYVTNQDGSVIRTLKGRIWPWAGEIDEFDYMHRFDPGIIYSDDDYSSAIKTSLPVIYDSGHGSYTFSDGDWHTVGVYKSKSELRFYVDRILDSTFDITGNPCFSGMGEKIIFDAKNGSLAGELPSDFTEAKLYIDYVKVYSLNDTSVTLASQAGQLIPDYVNGYSCVKDRYFLIRPTFALNTENTALYWSSSNTSVATVENGYVHTKANGTTVITATDADGVEVIRYTQTVADNAGVLAESITLLNAPVSIPYGASVAVSANIYPTQCDVLTLTLAVISGNDYVTIDGTNIINNNSTNTNQTVVVRVGTNNPSVYQDITMSALALVDNIDTNGIVAKYTLKGWKSDRWTPDLGTNQTWLNSATKMTYYPGLGYMNDYLSGAVAVSARKYAGLDLVDIDGPFTLAMRLYLQATDSVGDADLINLWAFDGNDTEISDANGTLTHRLKNSYYKYMNNSGNVVNGSFGSVFNQLDHTIDNAVNLVVVKTADGYMSAFVNGTQLGNTQSWFVEKAPINTSCRIGIGSGGGLKGKAYYQAFLAWNKAMTAQEIASLNTALNELYGTSTT